MAEMSKRFSIIEWSEKNEKGEAVITRTTEYLEYDEKGSLSRKEEGSFTLAEGDTLEAWFENATDEDEEKLPLKEAAASASASKKPAARKK